MLGILISKCLLDYLRLSKISSEIGKLYTLLSHLSFKILPAQHIVNNKLIIYSLLGLILLNILLNLIVPSKH
jgi:hypothetical protein